MLLSCTRHPANQQIRCRPISGIFGYRKNAACGSDNSFQPFRQEASRLRNIQTFFSCTRHPANQQIRCRPISGVFGCRKNATCGSDNSFLPFRQEASRLRNIQVLLSCTRHPANQQIRCRLISGVFGCRKNAACGSDNSFRPFRQEASRLRNIQVLFSCTHHPTNQQIRCQPISGTFGYRKNTACGSDNSFLLKHARKCQSSRLRNIQVLLSCSRHPANQQIRCRPISGVFGYRKNAACGSDNSFLLNHQEDVSPADYAISRRFYRVLTIRRTNRSAVDPSPVFSAIGKTLCAVLTTASCPSVKKTSVRQTTQHPGAFIVYSPSGEPANPLSAHLRHFRLTEKHCVRS